MTGLPLFNSELRRGVVNSIKELGNVESKYGVRGVVQKGQKTRKWPLLAYVLFVGVR